ncbi:MAG: DUF1822 family protein [Oscillatoriaceae bacterium SKW80]|nr:DUF1822 family protein [Oscillatoriaceae bacterium SKYG93]MCX8121773.1 DUF1822 family protein [Oscillatoriaceae bacterium SKW80]MDW8453611.1 DUF1822 family protein [Oscillatoriaceae cyanobacterium SKYGB_i_bin93]HIK28675.1 DUF1822 family protein [Oscillatoriaceae cyanobacterium M7585_C2015_266]
MNHAIEPITFTVSLSLSAHRAAEKFSRQQSNPRKAKQVYLNTLAVYAVNFYLGCLGFETDLENSESWNPVMQTLLDAADLKIKNIGKLECRAVLPDADWIEVPPEVWEDRIGCVAVKLSKSLREATLLGFIKQMPEKFFMYQLSSLEDLPEYLQTIARRSQPLSKIENPQNKEEATKPIEGAIAKLKQWFEGIFEPDWQPVELVLAANFRSPTHPVSGNIETSKASISRAKIINLGMQLAETTVALVVRLTTTATEEIDVRLRLYPARENYLPKDLKLTVVDESGKVCMEAQARRADNWIQLQFGALPGEKFSTIISLRDVSIKENFVI